MLVPAGWLVVCDMMFALSLQARDRALIGHKLAAVAREGPAGLLRIVRNAGRVATGRWEHPAPPEVWERMLRDRGFENVHVQLEVNKGRDRDRLSPSQDEDVCPHYRAIAMIAWA